MESVASHRHTGFPGCLCANNKKKEEIMSSKEGNPHSPDCIGTYAKQGKYAEKHIQTEEDEFPLAPSYLLPDGRVILVDFNVHMHDERGVTVNCYMTHWEDFDSIPYGGASAFRDEANFYDIFVPLDLILEHCDLSQVEYKLKDEEEVSE